MEPCLNYKLHTIINREHNMKYLKSEIFIENWVKAVFDNFSFLWLVISRQQVNLNHSIRSSSTKVSFLQIL